MSCYVVFIDLYVLNSFWWFLFGSNQIKHENLSLDLIVWARWSQKWPWGQKLSLCDFRDTLPSAFYDRWFWGLSFQCVYDLYRSWISVIFGPVIGQSSVGRSVSHRPVIDWPVIGRTVRRPVMGPHVISHYMLLLVGVLIIFIVIMIVIIVTCLQYVFKFSYVD